MIQLVMQHMILFSSTEIALHKILSFGYRTDRVPCWHIATIFLFNKDISHPTIVITVLLLILLYPTVVLVPGYGRGRYRK